MRFNRIRGQGWIGLRAPFDVNLQALPGPLVAITGLRGAGKTTLLELLLGALYRKMPTRGALTRAAVDPDAYVEVEIANGHRFTIRQRVNGINGDVGAVVFDSSKSIDDDDYAIIKSAKIPEYTIWSKRNLIPFNVVLSSSFTAQRADGFLDIDPAERRQLILQVRHIAHYEAMISRSRKFAEEAISQLLVAEARLADLNRDVLPLAEAEAQLRTCETAHAAAEDTLRRASVAMTEGNVAALLIEQNRRQREAVQTAGQQLMRLECSRDESLERIKTEKAKLAKLPVLRKSVQEFESLTAERLQLNVRIQAVLGDYNVLSTRISSAERRIRELEPLVTAANRRLTAALASQAQRSEIEAATLERPVLEQKFVQAGKRLERARALVDKLQAESHADAGTLIVNLEISRHTLRGGLIDIRDRHDLDPVDVATTTLQVDERALALSPAPAPLQLQAAPGEQLALVKTQPSPVPAKVQAAQLAVAEAVQESTAAYEIWMRAKELAGRSAELKRATSVEKTEQETLARFASQKTEAQAEIAAATREREASHQLRSDLKDELEKLDLRLAKLRPLQAQYLELQTAQGTITELAASVERLKAEILKAAAAAALLTMPAADPPAPDLTALAAAEAAADTTSRHTLVQLEAARTRAQAAQAQRTRRLELDALVAFSRDEAAQWERTANDIAGVQQMEVDAAGPELTTSINHFLHTCIGNRWTVKVVTQRPYAKGSRKREAEREVCDVIIYDSHHRREKNGDMLCGGERTLVNAACSLSLTKLGCQGLQMEESPTIIHDEVTGHLDHQDRPRYIAMLRLAAAILGADKILYVSHDLELQRLSDSSVHIEDGRIMAP